MQERKELWFAKLVVNNPPSALYHGSDKRVLVVSNDADNLDLSFPTVAVVPRRTRAGRTSGNEDAFPGTVKSPYSEQGCDRDGFYDCMQIHKVKKLRSAKSSFFQERISQIHENRMQMVSKMIFATLSGEVPVEMVAPTTGRPVRRTNLLRRGSLVSVVSNSGTELPAAVLGNDHLRRCCPFGLATVVLLEELPATHPSPRGRITIQLDVDATRKQQFVVIEETVATVDVCRDLDHCDGEDPPRFSETEIAKAVLAVARYLALEV